MNNTIGFKKIKTVYQLILTGVINYRLTAKTLKISRNTLKKYASELKTLIVQYPDELTNFNFYLARLKKSTYPNDKGIQLHKLFPDILKKINTENSNRGIEWKKYKAEYFDGLNHSQFNIYFNEWCTAHNFKLKRKTKISVISEEDLKTFAKWKKSSNKLKWDKAVSILEAYQGINYKTIGAKVDRSKDTIKTWTGAYAKYGISGLLRKERQQNLGILQEIEDKKANLIKLLHETPSLHGINRASWSLDTLSQAYQTVYNTSISSSSISAYIRGQGYSFRKAKETLTSPDPLFREKLANITSILSKLKPSEKFFSVDEFGPFAVKIKGGRSYVKNGESKTYPQLQKSKGCIICTAALELSTNQITHFYSKKKNTDEMIKLLEILLVQYSGQGKIYFSWDAASWHASKKLYKRIEEVNDSAYRLRNNSPLVELAPLPSSAQFLNVIESVFSGLAKAILHNSDYNSADKCKNAIDRHFEERNRHFIEHPHKAGNKIWGRELVIPAFDETKNCKDPKWR